MKRIEGRTPAKQDELDTALRRAMDAASGAAGVMISLGKELVKDRQVMTSGAAQGYGNYTTVYL